MEIKGIVAYEQLFTLELRHPVTDKPLGIAFKVRSQESEEAKKVLRRHLDEVAERRQKGKRVPIETIERNELEKAAALIASWDWGEHTYDGAVPELTVDTAVRILEREGWIYGQVVEAAGRLANFTLASEKRSPKS